MGPGAGTTSPSQRPSHITPSSPGAWQRARAQLLLEAADALVREATGGVAASILDRQDDDLNDNLKLLFGLQCARQELQGVADLLQPTTMRLSGTLTEAVDVGAVLGVP